MQKTVKYIKEYLMLSSIYGYLLVEKYKEMKDGSIDGIEFSPHGSGLYVNDTKRLIELDFDYIKYNGLNIEYFDLYKLNNFLTLKYGFKIESSDINSLLKHNIIKLDEEVGYYYMF